MSDANKTSLFLLVLLVVIFLVVTLIIKGGQFEYKKGFIDAKTGVEAYELVTNPDSTRTWEKK